MSKSEASVIIPTRNRPQALERCLDALAAQTMPAGSFEVIVVDDGSDPPLALDASRWATKFPLTVIQQQNTGPAGARNRGVAAAHGEFLAFTDDDCLPTPAWLESLVAALREHPAALVGGSTFNGLKDDLFAETSQLILEMVYDHFNRDPENAYFFASNNMACARENYLSLGGFDESFREASEDREFCDRWRMTGARLFGAWEAQVEHRHAQDFAAFTKLHFRYGRGAHRYKRLRAARASGGMGRDIAFHFRIPAMMWGRRKRLGPFRLAAVASLLAWWEAVNLLGFLAPHPPQIRTTPGPT